MNKDILISICVQLLDDEALSINDMSLAWNIFHLNRGKKKKLKRLYEVYCRKVQNRGIRHAQPNFNLRIFKFYRQRRDEEFRTHFRLHIDTFQKLIQFLFEEEKVHGWSLEIELMIFLFWLASGCSYRIVSVSFEMPKSTIVRILHKYLKLFSSNLHKFVKLPKQDELESIGEGFCTLAKNACFKKAAGAIDGCHVKIAKVPEEQAASYFSYKGSYSSNFQAVVDNRGIFIDVFIGFPGSVHDTRIFRNSPIFVNQAYPPRGYYLLGDGGYPLLAEPVGMIIPFTVPQINANAADKVMKSRFNALHSRARSVVERAFGRLKSRWRSIFFKHLECSYLRAPQVIASCVALHNFFVLCDDIIEPDGDDSEEEDDDGPDPGNQDLSGECLRLRIARKASRLALNGHLANDHNYIQP